MARTKDVLKQQRALSEATWAVMAERGLPGLTVRAVAERAGCTTGLVFHTFPNKKALLAHARQLLLERASARADAVEQHGGPAPDVLRNVALALIARGRDGEEEARVWISFLAASLADPALARYHLTGNRALLARMTRLVRAAWPEWKGERARQAAVELVALIEGLNTLGAVDPISYPVAAQRAAVRRAIAVLENE
ncbi:TetR/AcrR family transcriptional regulator [Kribbella sp. CA-253562]|uniref:TetR/AcrR family transcriptional regulator n=1 Tax=Kribbella sp. CA-253562 TaxID=3239942 RepID=UPI003D912A6B